MPPRAPRAPRMRSSARSAAGIAPWCASAASLGSCSGCSSSVSTWRMPQRVRPRPRVCEQRIDAVQPLEVCLQAFHEQRVEHEAELLGHVRRRARRGRWRAGMAHADHQDALRTEVYRGRERRRLAQRAVAEVRTFHCDGRKQERHGGARHQVVQVDRRWRRRAARLGPSPRTAARSRRRTPLPRA